jgi:hypothetical protein
MELKSSVIKIEFDMADLTNATAKELSFRAWHHLSHQSLPLFREEVRDVIEKEIIKLRQEESFEKLLKECLVVALKEHLNEYMIMDVVRGLTRKELKDMVSP